MSKKFALVIIGHLKSGATDSSEEELAGFAARLRRSAKEIGVTPVVGYTLTTKGSFLEVWEADDKSKLESFRQKLDALGHDKFYDKVLMTGEREAEWIHSPTA